MNSNLLLLNVDIWHALLLDTTHSKVLHLLYDKPSNKNHFCHSETKIISRLSNDDNSLQTNMKKLASNFSSTLHSMVKYNYTCSEMHENYFPVIRQTVNSLAKISFVGTLVLALYH